MSKSPLNNCVLMVVSFTFGLGAFAGCSPQPLAFVSNDVFIHKQERELKQPFNDTRRRDIQTALVALFGTPDEPYVAALGEVDTSKILDPIKLTAASGAVGRDTSGRARGLYREHCVHCHGVTGDGLGPTAAFLNPYPRDYRLGVFKFKSTPKGFKPTHDDLRRVLIEGIPGTAMPSFKLLTDDELEALVHYVRYLSLRGETERNIIQYCKTDLEENDRLIDVSLKESTAPTERKKYEDQLESVRTLAAEAAGKWNDADASATPVPRRAEAERSPEKVVESIRRGRELFYGVVANCIKCHGESALGDGQITDFDEWTKELDPTVPDAIAEYLDLGALPPRNIRPRNLRQGVYRGGRRPIDLFWRLKNGIDGSGMPAVLMKDPAAPADTKGLSQDDIWCLIDYVRSLPFESISRPPVESSPVHRDRL